MIMNISLQPLCQCCSICKRVIGLAVVNIAMLQGIDLIELSECEAGLRHSLACVDFVLLISSHLEFAYLRC